MERLSFLLLEEAVPDPGVIYRHLRRLEEEGKAKSRLEPESGGPARKIYSLTPEGERHLKAWAINIRQRKRLLEHFLKEFNQYFPLEQLKELDNSAQGSKGREIKE